ncbi:hypothetical protein ACW7BC_18280 [Azospirillum argentinense]
MTKRGITRDEEKQFEHTLTRYRLPTPTADDLARAFSALAVSGTAAGNGVVLRLSVLRDDGPYATDLALNPVVASHLLQIIMEAGRSGGWLDAKGNVKTHSGV